MYPVLFLRTPANYWDDNSNRRRFFEEYSKLKKFSYKQAENWYTIQLSDLEEAFPKEARALFSRFKWPDTLIKAFPELKLDKSRLKFLVPSEPVDYSDLIAQKNFFDELADEKQFDKSVADNWYNISRDDIIAKKGGQEIVTLLGGYIPAIMAAYPNIGLDAVKFRRVTDNFWKEATNRRQFFDEYARDRKFDPLVAENWYSVLYEDLVEHKGGSRVIRYHGTYSKALQELYPEISFNMDRFKKSEHWTFAKNRRRFFDEFAAENGFDPLIAEYWYKISRKAILSKKGGRTVIDYHGGVSKSLIELYPDVNFDSTRFKKSKTL